jgi:hypothetical protein
VEQNRSLSPHAAQHAAMSPLVLRDFPVNPDKAAALRQLSMKSYNQYQILAKGQPNPM